MKKKYNIFVFLLFLFFIFINYFFSACNSSSGNDEIYSISSSILQSSTSTSTLLRTNRELGTEMVIHDYSISQFFWGVVCAVTKIKNDDQFIISFNEKENNYYNSFGVFAQIFNFINGSNVTPTFQVNTFRDYLQFGQAVTSDEKGNYIFTWHSGGPSTGTSQDGSYYSVYGQKINSKGSFNGNEFLVNTHTMGIQEIPSIAELSNNSFVVCWASSSCVNIDSFDIVAKIFDLEGSIVKDEFLVNTTLAN